VTTAFAIASLVEADEARVKSLQLLRDLLARAEKTDIGDEDFKNLFTAAIRVLELDQDAAAGILRTSRPTVSRWASGRSTPHRVGRPSVFRELHKVASDRLRKHSSAVPISG